MLGSSQASMSDSRVLGNSSRRVAKPTHARILGQCFRSGLSMGCIGLEMFVKGTCQSPHHGS